MENPGGRHQPRNLWSGETNTSTHGNALIILQLDDVAHLNILPFLILQAEKDTGDVRFRGPAQHRRGQRRPDDELPSPDDDLRLAVVDSPIAPVPELQFTTEGFETPFRGRESRNGGKLH